MRVFVTVGTTRFDSLVSEVLKEAVIRELKLKGYDCIKIQSGKSVVPEDHHITPNVEVYDYKPSLKEDIESADLVVSHAGAGTCLEVLGANKPLIVVVNDQLMDNHQIELAEQLAKDNHCAHCVPGDLAQTIAHFQPVELAPFQPGNPKAFADFLDSLF